MLALLFVLLLLSAIGELKGINVSLDPQKVIQHLNYSCEVLLSLRYTSSIALPDNLPDFLITKPAIKPQRKKRGRRGGVRQRLKRRGNRPPLPSVILSNVRALQHKMDELKVHRRYCHAFREASIIAITETFLDQSVPDSMVDLEGFSCIRTDRKGAFVKASGGGLIVYVNDNWCKQFTVRSHVCNRDLELLCLYASRLSA